MSEQSTDIVKAAVVTVAAISALAFAGHSDRMSGFSLHDPSRDPVSTYDVDIAFQTVMAKGPRATESLRQFLQQRPFPTGAQLNEGIETALRAQNLENRP